MFVPTVSAFLATSTFGPSGTAAGAAAACCAPAPANIFLAMMAVTTAMTNAPTSRASFFTSMAQSPPLEGPQTSGKMVKKALGENREAAKGDRDTVRNLRTSLPILGPMPCNNGESQDPAGKRHQNQKFDYCRR